MSLIMTCLRCQGLLQLEVIPRGQRRALELLACTACGDRIDATILAHRRGMLARDESDWKVRLWERIRTLTSEEVAV